MPDFDTTVVGAGPNGLSAAVELARAGRSVLVVEAEDAIGGGARTEELTLPGFRHDICSAIHPTGVASPFFEKIGLNVDWVHAPVPFSHPLDGGRSVALFRSIEETASQFGRDRGSYLGLMTPLVMAVDDVIEDFLSPMTLVPEHFATFARMATLGALPASVLVRRFQGVAARSLLAGLLAHAIAPFNRPATAGVGLLLGVLGHALGWPMPRGGSRAITDDLAAKLQDLGGRIETGRVVISLEELPGRQFFLDLMPPAAFRVSRSRLGRVSRPPRRWRPGPGVFKVDWALDGPVPWADELSAGAATVHLGGSYDEVESAERAVAAGRHPERPFVLFAQQSRFDSTRSPAGTHTGWAYCHVPNGSDVDMTEAIERQVERFAPGFRDLILARHTINATQYQAHNANLVGGDIGGGRYSLGKVLQLGRRRPYSWGKGIFVCSSATPPGAGVHGLCGYFAARAALG